MGSLLPIPAAVAGFALVVACNGTADQAEQPATVPPGPVGVSVTDPWCSELGADEIACYMSLTAALEGDALVDVRVPEDLATAARVEVVSDERSVATLPDGEPVADEPGDADPAELDDVVGESAREPVERLEIPAEGTVQLQPTGYKVVISGIQVDVSVGQEVEMVLVFERAGEFVVVTDVRQP